MIEIPDLVAGCLSAGTLAAFVLGAVLLRSRRVRARQRQEIAALRGRLDESRRATAAEMEHLADKRVPAALQKLNHPHLPVPGPLLPEAEGGRLGAAFDRVLAALREAQSAQRRRIDAAAQAGMRGATREVQAGLYRLQDALRALQEKYDDPELAGTLFALEHENEQSLRRAQVTAVVCGAWVGLAREESHVVDAVTGGLARLTGYQRVRVHNHLKVGTALVSHAVEPVAIIVAELLDNALRHSAPDTDVVMQLEHVHHGVCVTIDDSGVGMTEDERDRAQRLVGGREPILLTDLGDPPRMGLAAIGQLTRQFDLNVDLTSRSPYGGVRAVIRVDGRLLTTLDPEEQPQAASSSRSTLTEAPAQAAAPEDGAHSYAAEREAPVRGGPAPVPVERPAPAPVGQPGPAAPAAPPSELPRRRRRTPAAPGAEHSPPPANPVRRPEEAAAALGALQAGTEAARAAAPEPPGAPAPRAAVPVLGTAEDDTAAAGPDTRDPAADSTASTESHPDNQGGAAR
ncbi:ATP-binding protein [Streptomyces sp. NPDC050560]|uniref:ATP-binding protein n=1 Tax=Streptomyces sp. NPDC050560 TaxID=3365630 RepID=UPI0037BCE397